METRLRKEVRELLPVLAATLALIVSPTVLWRGDIEALGVITLLMFALSCAVMGGMAFGSEFQHRTIGLLLAQPVRRSVLWWEKMGVLGAGLVVNFAAVLVCLVYGKAESGVPGNVVPVLATMPLCAFCGAPYLTLLTRNGLGGMVFATVLPIFILVFTAQSMNQWLPGINMKPVVLSSLLLYCLVAGWRGYCRFRDLELKDGGPGEVALLAGVEGWLGRALSRVMPGVSGPWITLVRKELRLQQMSFLLAGVFSVLVVVAGVAHWRHAGWGQGVLATIYGIYLLILPMMVGAIAVAEERALGIAEWHLTLPVPAWKQWAAKMGVALPTSAALGLLLPGLLFLAGIRLFDLPWQNASFLSTETAGFIVLLQTLATSVAVYTASACGSTLRAILQAFALFVAGNFVVFYEGTKVQHWAKGWGHPLNESLEVQRWLWCGGTLVMLYLLQRLAFCNFRRCGVSQGGYALQLIKILLSLAVLAGVLFALRMW